MKYHLIINNNCNLDCRYCSKLAFDERANKITINNLDEQVPSEIKFDVSALIDFLRQDKDPWLIFYGGEPLLSHSKIEEIIQKIDFPINYVIQTNGVLLDKLSASTINRFNTVLVSIDGCKETTDYFRGDGTYGKVISNLKQITKNGYKGNIIARMTIMEPIDIEKEVRYLLNNKDFSLKEIHWQLNANFYTDFSFRGFQEWSKSYLQGIYNLADFWVKEMTEKQKVITLYPFLGIVKRFLELEDDNDFSEYYLPCGSGHSNYSIQTDGNIIPCPIMVGMKDYYLGNIKYSKPEIVLSKKYCVSGECLNCNHYQICGGRCLYSNITKPWNNEQSKELCQVTKKTIDYLHFLFPKIKQLIADEKINISDFDYEKYIGPEIIP